MAGTTGDANTPAASAAMCQPSQLGLALVKYLQPAMNQPAAYFSLTNTSASTCTLDGYPGFQPYDSAGKPVTVTVERKSTFQINDPGPQLVTLAPAASAYFGMGWGAIRPPSGTSAGFSNVTSVASVPPNDLTSLSATAALGTLCPGSVTVTAVAPATAFSPSTP